MGNECYQIVYTESAVRDLEEKVDYIAFHLQNPVWRKPGICGCGQSSPLSCVSFP